MLLSNIIVVFSRKIEPFPHKPLYGKGLCGNTPLSVRFLGSHERSFCVLYQHCTQSYPQFCTVFPIFLRLPALTGCCKMLNFPQKCPLQKEYLSFMGPYRKKPRHARLLKRTPGGGYTSGYTCLSSLFPCRSQIMLKTSFLATS